MPSLLDVGLDRRGFLQRFLPLFLNQQERVERHLGRDVLC